ncbi:MAG: hypothetical protein KME49_26055 [Brasilonema octagenarum HA4186-MV1]|jgi:hypothetical protein|uniref:hypothetical protein n=1 Tax=Brasilonema octagenarum TaxID=417105 RepID=UPI00145EFC4E|nr:hypothetical protein [Brasilonema octagenarum]MBW4628881.1 hypothetical protein [Brasilonema octagenarum HA4186-MV1]
MFIGSSAFVTPGTTDDKPFEASLAPSTVFVSSTTSPKSDDGLFRRLTDDEERSDQSNG